MEVVIFAAFIIGVIGFIFLMRLLGAWMFRINEIISNQNAIIAELRNLNRKQAQQVKNN
jgi:hypothetical protein